MGSQYASEWSRLSLASKGDRNLVVLDGHRVVVPMASRRKVLDSLYLPHMAKIKTLRNACQDWFWEGMTEQIHNMTSACTACLTHSNSKQQTQFVVDREDL